MSSKQNTEGSSEDPPPFCQQDENEIDDILVTALELGLNEFCAVAIGSDSRPHVTVKIGKTIMQFLYDTGSQISLIAKQECERIIGSYEQRPVRAIGANKKPLKISGHVNTQMSLLGDKHDVKLFVSDELSSSGILGLDIITQIGANYCATSNLVFGPKDKKVRLCHTISLEPNEVRMVQVHSINSESDEVVVENIKNDVMIPPSLVHGKSTQPWVSVHNTTAWPIHVKGDTVIGIATPANALHSVDSITQPRQPPASAAPALCKRDKEDYIRKNLNTALNGEERRQLEKLILSYHDVVSTGPYDLGSAKGVELEIKMRDPTPIFRRQFPLPEVHRNVLIEYITELLKLKALKTTCGNPWNSPIFVVRKPSGAYRVVVDLRQVNAAMEPAYHTGITVAEALTTIGRLQPQILTAIDLRQGFFQVKLAKDSQNITGFTIPGYGSFAFTRSPQGLLSSPFAFWALISKVTHGLRHTIAYLDDLLVASSSTQQHLRDLQDLLQRLREFNLKLNLEKCHLAVFQVEYLGFTITPQGAKPGRAKTMVLQNYQPPASTKQVMAFLGLASYFRKHIRGFSYKAAPLIALTSRKHPWKKGTLPPEAMAAFEELRKQLTSHPVIRFPDFSRPFHLSVDASTGDLEGKKIGGLGACLEQFAADGAPYVVGYGSRTLKGHELNYHSFNLEALALTFGLEYFDVYLRGRHFFLHSDNNPVVMSEKVAAGASKQSLKTFSRLSEALQGYDCTLIHKAGAWNIPSDFMSRNAEPLVCVINTTGLDLLGYSTKDLVTLQNADPYCVALRNFLNKKATPQDKLTMRIIGKVSNNAFLSDKQVLFINEKGIDGRSLPKLFVPADLYREFIHAAHHSNQGGHAGIHGTLARLRTTCYWPTITNDVTKAIQTCEVCQKSREVVKRGLAPIIPLPQPDRPFETVFVDLHGPILDTTLEKNYILVMICQFSKMVELVALADKTAELVAAQIFSNWVCRYGAMKRLTSDLGSEFHNTTLSKLCLLMGVEQAFSTSGHPASHGQVEQTMRIVVRFLRAFTDHSTLDWPSYLPPLMFHINSAYSTSLKTSPFQTVFGMSPVYPVIGMGEEQRDLIMGDDKADELYRRIQITRRIARENNMFFRQAYQKRFNSNRTVADYTVGQKILFHNPLGVLRAAPRGGNTKFHKVWTGPFEIVKTHQNNNVTIEFPGKRGKHRLQRLHVDRIKPYYEDLAQHDLVKTNKDTTQKSTTPAKANNEEEMPNIPDTVTVPTLLGPGAPTLQLSDDENDTRSSGDDNDVINLEPNDAQNDDTIVPILHEQEEAVAPDQIEERAESPDGARALVHVEPNITPPPPPPPAAADHTPVGRIRRRITKAVQNVAEKVTPKKYGLRPRDENPRRPTVDLPSKDESDTAVTTRRRVFEGDRRRKKKQDDDADAGSTSGPSTSRSTRRK